MGSYGCDIAFLLIDTQNIYTLHLQINRPENENRNIEWKIFGAGPICSL